MVGEREGDGERMQECILYIVHSTYILTIQAPSYLTCSVGGSPSREGGGTVVLARPKRRMEGEQQHIRNPEQAEIFPLHQDRE